MKLQIKTLNQKSLMVDIELSKTVYDLKKELSLYPDVGVQPELQKLIYAGKILINDDPLSAYNIDAKKFLVVMVLKQPEEGATVATQSETSTTAAVAAAAAAATTTATAAAKEASSSTSAAPRVSAPSVATETGTTIEATAPATQESTARRTSPPPASNPAGGESRNEELVANIVSMGYPEVEVRRALAASFNNPERAIEYLIEGIPDSVLMQPGEVGVYGSEGDAEMGMSPFEMFRSDPLFRNLRRAIQQHPELINDAIQRVGEANPAILELINENQQEFLSSLIEGSDDDDDDDDDVASHGGGGGGI